MIKELIFDMDGTIADLYGVEDWLLKLQNEDPSPYEEAKPLYDPYVLNILLDVLKKFGYQIKVVSWKSKDSSSEYDKLVRKAKIEWLKRYSFPADKIHIIKYGTPKSRFCDKEANFSFLIDDNLSVRTEFVEKRKSKVKNENRNSSFRIAVDPVNENLFSYLLGLIEKEV